MPEMVVLPVPLMVRAIPAPVIPPDKLSEVPEAAWIVVAPPSVMAPPKVLLPETFFKAPSVETPVPTSDKASAPIVMLLESQSAPPLLTAVPAPVVPNALA